MKRTRVILAAFISMVVVLYNPVLVFAADPYLDYGSQTGRVSVKPYTQYNEVWEPIIDSGIANWNNSAANVSISVSSNSSNTIEAAQYFDTWYGLTTQNYNTSTGYTTSFVIQINARTITDDATNVSNFAISTVVHEFGHVFWLCDNPITTKPSIMKYDRDRNTMTALVNKNWTLNFKFLSRRGEGLTPPSASLDAAPKIAGHSMPKAMNSWDGPDARPRAPHCGDFLRLDVKAKPPRRWLVTASGSNLWDGPHARPAAWASLYCFGVM